MILPLLALYLHDGAVGAGGGGGGSLCSVSPSPTPAICDVDRCRAPAHLPVLHSLTSSPAIATATTRCGVTPPTTRLSAASAPSAAQLHEENVAVRHVQDRREWRAKAVRARARDGLRLRYVRGLPCAVQGTANELGQNPPPKKNRDDSL